MKTNSLTILIGLQYCTSLLLALYGLWRVYRYWPYEPGAEAGPDALTQNLAADLAILALRGLAWMLLGLLIAVLGCLLALLRPRTA